MFHSDAHHCKSPRIAWQTKSWAGGHALLLPCTYQLDVVGQEPYDEA